MIIGNRIRRINMNKFQNPIIKGFHPDPSICRVGEDYFLVTSSFCYFPGLPVFHSRDLVHWEQIGHGISRSSQLDYRDCDHSGGLWAPTIRYYEGTFYIINTFSLKNTEAGPDSVCINYVITTNDIYSGKWSDPIVIQGADGIDPSLYFENGRLWYTGNCCPSVLKWPGHRQIYIMELNPVTFQPIKEKTIIWDGDWTHDDYVEAPHIYKIKDYYYLMIAAGGTQENHSVMIARSRKIEGSYELCPRNPIVTLRNIWNNPYFASAGHGDLVQTQNGEWWMVLLAVRPYNDYQYNCGRETCLVPIAWDKHGWPYVDNKTGSLEKEERLPTLKVMAEKKKICIDNFENPVLSDVWNTIRPWEEDEADLKSRPGYLRLYGREAKISDNTHCSFVGRRQEDKSFIAVTKMESCLKAENDFAGIALIQDNNNYILFGLEAGNGAECIYLRLEKCIHGKKQECYKKIWKSDQIIYLGVNTWDNKYIFFWGSEENNYKNLDEEISQEILSTSNTGGFTGVYVGMYVMGNRTKCYADYDWFEYNSVE